MTDLGKNDICSTTTFPSKSYLIRNRKIVNLVEVIFYGNFRYFRSPLPGPFGRSRPTSRVTLRFSPRQDARASAQRKFATSATGERKRESNEKWLSILLPKIRDVNGQRALDTYTPRASVSDRSLYNSPPRCQRAR